MDTVSILSPGSIGKNFIPAPYLPANKDEYHYRNLQTLWSLERWRHLRAAEVELLVKNNNTSSDWDDILVTEQFDPSLIVNNQFFGLVRIGRLQKKVLEHNDLRLPAGITGSIIIACDIGDDVAIHNVGYLSHFIIGDRCILSKVDEMNTSDHAKFGNGIIKKGEKEEVRIWLDLMNEAGCRRVAPFDGMIAADAWLWAKYRDDQALQARLKEITQQSMDAHRGFYGMIGTQTVIKNSLILKDVKIGAHCYIKGANKLKNLTIHSSLEEPTQIGEGVELVNGIIGYGCHIFYGCKAVRFILGDNSNLKYGARLINSFLGDNSTISCCEVLNNLIFPAHEQHHNNSFLVAGVVLGQSNIAAGATIGSNHNSRANDNELQAGRGFWPGLCTSIKHSSRFASFTLLSKADYPAELDIPLPFALLNNNPAQDRLEVMPAYWWMYNMYALARNAGKYHSRDKRRNKIQHIEFDALAPDTIEEILSALHLLEIWTGRARARAAGGAETGEATKPAAGGAGIIEASKPAAGGAETGDADELAAAGRELLAAAEDRTGALEILGERMEHSSRKVVILKARKAWGAYREMILYYGVKNLLAYLEAHPDAGFAVMRQALDGPRTTQWANFGGQLISETDASGLRAEIGAGRLASWDEIHGRYDALWERYPLDKQKHAWAALCALLGVATLEREQWLGLLDEAVRIQYYIRDQIYLSRKKDYDNPFHQSTFRSPEEMAATVGTIAENSFVQQVRAESEKFTQRITACRNRT
ncbi:MAG TPA: DUF4954 family protein [bacterium]|nr:DUF4954 family protein [bacterium]HPR89427.1 DUF4954 family protein [bacterium]